MARYEVSLKYGDPGKSLNNGQKVLVDADSESVAMKLAVNKLKFSNGSTYIKKQIEAVAIRKI